MSDEVLIDGCIERHGPFLVPILLNIQDHYRYLPEECLTLLSKKLGMPLSDVYGVASFYRAFSFTPKGKLKGKWGKIPTFEELGYGKDMVYYMQRSIVGPPGMSKDAQAYYVGVFEKVYQSGAWQKYLNSKGLVPGWLTGSKLQSYFIAERAKHAALLKSLGEIK